MIFRELVADCGVTEIPLGLLSGQNVRVDKVLYVFHIFSDLQMTL